MSALRRALRAERLKLRGTLALWLCLIAPLLVVAVVVLQLLFNPPSAHAAARTPSQAWLMFAQGTMALWSFLMLPLFITLQSALLAGLEHNERQWKHLLALPLPRHVHYVAKLVALVAIVAAAHLALVLLVAAAGGLLGVAGPDTITIAGAPPWTFLLSRAAAITAAAGLLVALHTWIAIRWRSFTVAVATGMTATVMGFLIGQSARFGPWYPWSMPTQVFAGEGEKIVWMVGAGLLGGAAVAAAGLLDYLRRDVA